MVGPVVRIEPAALPQRPNIRWVGLQRHEALPHLMAHWDVCLLPFVLDETTRFIDPARILEYLAGGKPVVSTPIPDALSLYAPVLRIGATAEEVVAAVEAALAEPPEAIADRRARARALVDARTWDAAADTVAGLLLEYVERRTAAPILLYEPLADAAPRAASQDHLELHAMPPDRVEQPAKPLAAM
jgi:glycosyltransferase involved in cell wall biosynthesis